MKNMVATIKILLSYACVVLTSASCSGFGDGEVETETSTGETPISSVVETKHDFWASNL